MQFISLPGCDSFFVYLCGSFLFDVLFKKIGHWLMKENTIQFWLVEIKVLVKLGGQSGVEGCIVGFQIFLCVYAWHIIGRIK